MTKSTINWQIGDSFTTSLPIGMGTNDKTVFTIEKHDSGIRYQVNFISGLLTRHMLFEGPFLDTNFNNGNLTKVNK